MRIRWQDTEGAIVAAKSATGPIALQDEAAAFENVLGVYLIDPDGTIRDPEIVFARIEHADPLHALGLPAVWPSQVQLTFQHGSGPSR
jgi:hypothetical protein